MMHWLSLTFISLFALATPTVCMVGFVYEMRTGRKWTLPGMEDDPPLSEKTPLAQAAVLLLVLANLTLVAGGIAFFAGLAR